MSNVTPVRLLIKILLPGTEDFVSGFGNLVDGATGDYDTDN